jgi:hypothetical protein
LASVSKFMSFISKYHNNYAENQGSDRDGIQRDHMLILDKRVHTHAPKENPHLQETGSNMSSKGLALHLSTPLRAKVAC